MYCFVKTSTVIPLSVSGEIFLISKTKVHYGEGNGTPLQYSCLENSMDGGAWWATVHGVTKSRHDWATSLSLFTFMHWRRKWLLLHGIFQARVLEWIAISFSRGSSWPRNRTWVSCTAGRCFIVWATREAVIYKAFIKPIIKLFDN